VAAMTPYETIKESLKTLLLTTSLQNITVKEICEKAFVSRKTFYEHFSDKYDVIDKIIRDDVIQSVVNLHDLLPKTTNRQVLISERFYQNIYNNREFYIRLNKGKGRDCLKNSLFFYLFEGNAKLMQKYFPMLSVEEKEYINYFIATSQILMIIKWLLEGCKITPHVMAEYYCKYILAFDHNMEMDC
jgi:AcrR family transcriptional regulator